ncbi:MAG TPA: glycosyltransferase family 4 protein [Candidatus Dormibacteraeota bacterium]
MGRPLKIGLYSPYFGSALGGGEKYLGVAAEAVRDGFPEHAVDIVSPRPADRALYEKTLNLDLSGIGLVATNPRPGAIRRAAARARILRPLRNRAVARQAHGFTARYDLFLAMAYVIQVSSAARASAVLCQFPYPLESEAERRALEQFQLVICQSEYVRGWTRKRWGREAAVVNPPIDLPAAAPDLATKRPIILSVGRFVAGGHNKRHDLLARAFVELCAAGLSEWELHLAGTVHHDRASRDYLDRIRALARGRPIRIHENLPHAELDRLYEAASLYWHAAGYGVDEEAHPEALEHFGMATAEAMARGAVPVVIARGGQLEVVRDGVDGRTWTDLEGLQRITRELAADPGARQRLAQAATASSARWSRSAFKRNLLAALAPLLEQLEAAG